MVHNKSQLDQRVLGPLTPRMFSKTNQNAWSRLWGLFRAQTGLGLAISGLSPADEEPGSSPDLGPLLLWHWRRQQRRRFWFPRRHLIVLPADVRLRIDVLDLFPKKYQAKEKHSRSLKCHKSWIRNGIVDLGRSQLTLLWSELGER